MIFTILASVPPARLGLGLGLEERNAARACAAKSRPWAGPPVSS